MTLSPRPARPVGPDPAAESSGSSSSWTRSTVFLLTFVVLLVVISQWEQVGLQQVADAVGDDVRVQSDAIGEPDSVNTHFGKVRQISLIGERNSGTRWTNSHLSKCFGHEIKVTTTFTRYKHWFQFPAYNRYPHDTLVVAQFRNPYDWLKAMQHTPHHIPNHLKYSADEKWKEFLTEKWTMERIGTDRWDNLTEPCQQHFEYKDVISCAVEPLPHEAYNSSIKYSEHQPFYEMRNDGSGEPYDNIMQMRSDKIRNFLTVADYTGVADLWIVQYEYLLAKGTQELIDDVAAWTGIKPNCTAFPPQQRESRPIEKEMAEFIRDNLDWEAEALIGYGPHK